MTSTVKSTLAAALAFGAVTLGALTLGAPAASAMPMGFAPTVQGMGAQIDNVRWVCGPYRCHWRPDYRRRHHRRHYGWRRW